MEYKEMRESNILDSVVQEINVINLERMRYLLSADEMIEEILHTSLRAIE